MRQGLATGSGRKRVWLHLIGLAAFSGAIYLPLLGRGFILDDFLWINLAAHSPWRYGFLHPGAGAPLYSPLVLMTFRLDWILWRFHAFPYAVENLVLHIANTFLLYGLGYLLWRSLTAAWWAAFGFALLYTANVWAVMWIATRGHLLATFFYVGALCATIWFAHSPNHRLFAGSATVALAAAAMLSKESGVTVVLAIPFMLWLEQSRPNHEGLRWRAGVLLMTGLLGVGAAYLVLRTRAGALSIVWSSHASVYQYKLSGRLIADNLSHYAGWTYGLQAILGVALAGSLAIRGARPRLAGVTGKEAMISVLLFLTSLAPVIFIPGRSGIYSYLPGVGASLLLGAAVRSQDPERRVRNRLLSAIPVFAVIAVYVAFARGQAERWKYMAEDDAAVLSAIYAQLPHPATGTRFLLQYDLTDTSKHRFHNGFASWGFSPALQILYSDPTMKGAVVAEGETPPADFGLADVEFTFRDGSARLRALNATEGASRRSP